MNNWLAILILIVGTLLCTYFVPWYFIAFIGLTLGYLWNTKGLNSFAIGLLIPTITWITVLLINGRDQEVQIVGILSELFGGISYSLIYITTGLIIGIVSGLAMLCGNILYKIKAN